jgi:flagellar biosynthetic protein FliP
MTADSQQIYLPRTVRIRGAAASTARFLWHFVQMVLAMMIGMPVYYMLIGKALNDYPVLKYAGMELAMVPPMVALMLYQRHGWRHSAEMVAAMTVGPAVLLACAQLGLHIYVPGLTRETLFSWSHVAMYLGMLAAMLYRRDMYTAASAHHHHAG